MNEKIQTFGEAQDFLNQRVNLERIVQGRRARLDLAPMKKLAVALDFPERSFHCVHIAGTVGKGSTAHFIGALLSKLGIRTGLYTSPHLEHITERIQVGQQNISRQEFVRVCQRLSQLANTQDATYFDLLTTSAFLYFRASQVEWAVVETGIGGRIDSTNIVQPQITVITSVGSDHADVLGATIENRAREKAGIIKQNTPLVCGVEDKTALQVIQEIAQQHNAPIYQYGKEIVVESATQTAQEVLTNIVTPWQRFAKMRIPSLALYQAKNLALALAAVDALAQSFAWGKKFTPATARTVNFVVPGRMEQFSGNPLIIIDGAHMPEAVSAVIASLKRLDGPKVVLFGAARDKDISAMLKVLSVWADKLVVTACPDNPRAVPANELYTLARRHGILVEAGNDLTQALATAKSQAMGGLLLVTGSLHLVGAARNLLRRSH